MAARIATGRPWQTVLGSLGVGVLLIACSVMPDLSAPLPNPGMTPTGTSAVAPPSPSRVATKVASAPDLTIRPANVAQLGELASWQASDVSPVRQVAWSPDGHTIAALVDNQVVLWDAESKRELGILAGSLNAQSFSPDGQLLATGAEDNTVKLWNVSARSELHTLSKHSSPVRTLSFSPDGSVLFAGSTYGPQEFWDATTGREIRNLDYKVGGVAVSSAFSPDGRLLALGTGSSRGGGIELWRVADLEKLQTLFDGRDDKYSVAFSPDGRWLASGSLYGNVKLWDVESGRELSVLTVPQTAIQQVAFSPDGQLLAVATREPVVRLLDVKRWSELHSLTGHTAQVNGVTFSPDGKFLATGSADSIIKLWGVRP